MTSPSPSPSQSFHNTAHSLLTPLTHPTLPSPSQLPHPIIFLAGTTNFDSQSGETRWQGDLISSLSSPSSTSSISSSPNTNPTPNPNHNPNHLRHQPRIHVIPHINTSTSTTSPSQYTIIDPYNSTWDSSWRESPSNLPFSTQVSWELHAQSPSYCDILVLAFCGKDARSGKMGVGGTCLCELGVALGYVSGASTSESESKSVASTSEIGGEKSESKSEVADGEASSEKKKQRKILVCVEEGYWKQGYVEMLCEKFGVPCFKILEELEVELRKMVSEW